MRGLELRAWSVVATLLAATAALGFSIPRVPGEPNLNLPGLDDLIAELIKEDPPVSTALEDALTAAPLMDGYEPAAFQNGDQLPRHEDGTWLLAPGAYEYHIQSYCLHAGTHGPGDGEGYVLAPLKGSRSGPIASILRNTWRFPDIPQADAQMLIWAIEARTPLGNMPNHVQDAARQLLTQDELNQINAASIFDRLAPGGRGAVPDAILNRVMGKLPEAARAPFRAQARIRNLMVTGSPTFQQIEQLAVLTGDTGNGPGEVPKGRWSWHPSRYFVRYFPKHYSKTVVQIIVPEQYGFERDDKGRIVALFDAQGWRVETVYDDAIAPLTVPDFPGLKGYMIKTIRFISPDPDNAGQTKTIELADRGWTLVGRPALVPVARAGSGLWFATEAGPWWGGGLQFADHSPLNWGETTQEWQARLEQAKLTDARINDTVGRWSVWRREAATGAVDDLTDLKHYAVGLAKAADVDPYDKDAWIGQHLRRVAGAWVWAADRLAGGDVDGAVTGSGAGSGFGSWRDTGGGVTLLAPRLDVSKAPPERRHDGGGVAMPGDRDRQRLGQSLGLF